MNEATAGRAIPGIRTSFHLWMALLMSFFVFGGFGMTYLKPMALGTMPPTPPVVHLHGGFFFSWMLMLVTQSVLVNARNVRLHRSLGTLGIALAGILVLMGALITIISASTSTWSEETYGLFYLSTVAPPSFAVLFTMAIRSLKTPAVHRNLMLVATLGILMPGINRLYMMGLGLDHVPFLATYLTMDVMLAAILFNEQRATGAISRMTWAAAAVIVVPQLLMPVAVQSAAFHAFCQFMATLAHYR